jgi:hypothetical protein
MSFDIGSVGQLSKAPAAQGTAPGTEAAQDLTATDADQEAVAVETFLAPPPELSGTIATAAQAYHNLTAARRRLHFAIDPPTGRLTIELQDASGNVLTTITPSKVLDLAAGGNLS